MNVTAYCHGWVGAGVAAALVADPDINPTFVVYPDSMFHDRHPCPTLDIVHDVRSNGPLFSNDVTAYRWPSKPNPDGCDAVVTANWRHVLSEDRYRAARLGGFNIHNSLLPDYKGRRPIQRALENGDHLLGYTIHRLSPEIDSGEILFKRPLWLGNQPEARIYETFGLLAGNDLLRVLKEQQNARRNKK